VLRFLRHGAERARAILFVGLPPQLPQVTSTAEFGLAHGAGSGAAHGLAPLGQHALGQHTLHERSGVQLHFARHSSAASSISEDE
jgi:hypothetical protein